MTVIKHFPGMGNHDGNLDSEDWIPTLIHAPEKDLVPFRRLADFSTGIMTSHVFIGNENDVVTFDEDYVSGLIRRNQNEQGIEGLANPRVLTITDDLSDMKPFVALREQRGLSWSDIALRAFRAGHDLLLFAHIRSCPPPTSEATDCKSPDAPSAEELFRVRDDLFRLIEIDEIFKQRFHESLRRIMYAKWSYWQRLDPGLTIEEFLHNPRAFPSEKQDIHNTGIEFRGEQIRLSSRFLTEIHRQAFTHLTENVPDDLSQASRILFIPERFKTGFEGLDSDPKIRVEWMKSEYKNERDYRAQWNLFIGTLEDSSFDYVLVLPSRTEHYHMLDHAALYARGSLHKAIVLVHSNPKNISREVGLRATVVGTFSWHRASFDIDVSYILGSVRPKSGAMFPVSFVRTIAELTHPRMRTPVGIAPVLEPSTDINELKLEMDSLRLDVRERDEIIAGLNSKIDDFIGQIGTFEERLDLASRISRYLVIWWVAVIAAGFLSLHRQGRMVYEGKKGGIAYLYDSLVGVRGEPVPLGVQESTAIIVLGILGLWFALEPESENVYSMAAGIMLGPTLVGLVRYRYLYHPEQSLGESVVTYIETRRHNPQVLLFAVLGLILIANSKSSALQALWSWITTLLASTRLRG